MLELFTSPEVWATLVVLTALEIVLSIDNLVFIAILSNKLPPHQQKKARRLGLLLAVGFRIALLSTAAMLMHMNEPVFHAFGEGFSVRDLILLLGGLFLIWKATTEIHERVSIKINEKTKLQAAGSTFKMVIFQIVLIDLVFSIDSIITAVGLADHLPVMILAVLIAVGTMILASEPLARFINNNPTIVMLALAFLVMIGMALVAESFHHEIPKAFIYVAMAFSLAVESLNMLQRKAARKRELQ